MAASTKSTRRGDSSSGAGLSSLSTKTSKAALSAQFSASLTPAGNGAVNSDQNRVPTGTNVLATPAIAFQQGGAKKGGFGAPKPLQQSADADYTMLNVKEERMSLLRQGMGLAMKPLAAVYGMLTNNTVEGKPYVTEHMFYDYEMSSVSAHVRMSRWFWLAIGALTMLFSLAVFILLLAGPSKTPWVPIAYSTIFLTWLPGQSLVWSQWDIYLAYTFYGFIYGLLMFGPACSYVWWYQVSAQIYFHGKNTYRSIMFFLFVIPVVFLCLQIVYFQDPFLILSVSLGWAFMIASNFYEQEKTNAHFLAERNRENVFTRYKPVAVAEIEAKAGQLDDGEAAKLISRLDNRGSRSQPTWWSTFYYACFALIGIMTWVFVYMGYVLSAPQVYGQNYYVILTVPLVAFVGMVLLFIFHAARYSQGYNRFVHTMQSGISFEGLIWPIIVGTILNYNTAIMLANIYAS